MNLYLDILLNIIVKTYFLDSRCLLVFTDEDNYFDYNGDIPVINIKVSKDSINPHLFLHYFGCKAVLIKTNNPVTVFEQFENEIRTSIERFNERKFLIAPGLHINENITNIFLSHSIRYVVDFVAITLADYSWNNNSFISKHIERYNLWTHKYVGFDYSQKELLDTWYSVNRSFVHNSNLYEYKLKNQMGRTLRMATFQYEPYSIPGETINDHKGSELYSMIIFAKYINATPELVINPKDYWGYIFDNWTGNGLVGNLADDKADIGFAALYTWEADYHFLDLSTALIRTGITCLVPAPKLAAGWLTPLFSYSYPMWCSVAAIFIVSILVHALMFLVQTTPHRPKNEKLNQKTKYKNSVFVIFKLFLSQIVQKSEIPPGKHGIIFMAVLFISSFFFTCSYCSGLSTVMTVPIYENSISTIDDFVNSNLIWVGTHNGWIDSILQADDEIYKIIVDKFLPIPNEDTLRAYSKMGDKAFALERLPRGNYAIGKYIKDDTIEHFRLMKEDFYWEEAVVMTRKSSILLPELNKFILRVFEAGLISVWQNEAVMSGMDPYIQKVVQYYTTNKDRFIVELKLIHVAGAFSILGFGFIISTIIFLFEISITNLLQCKKVA
ncbi:glutamate receptor ionotropic, delta-2-like [Diabrotica virgifera virgifera]|uniref:Ionotropic glutamate receptor C-terminal domain-containing protein n=1 Tax=Diabrotica virgifera virgifera TaxID=50390 RepID=A0ABM5L093_DIAVI|nr:glutamate receptor ionotropic, delta-2-like [Diabrotica virgifera virgifera]